MNYIVDIVLLLVIAYSVIVAVKKGFLRMLLEFIAYIVAIVSATLSANHFAPKLYESYFKDGVYRGLQARMGDSETIQIIDQARDAISSVPGELRAVAEKFGVNVTGLTEKLEGMNHDGSVSLGIIADDIVAPIIISVCKITIFVLVTVIIIAILRIVISAINNIFKLPVLRTVNGLLGGVLGFILGLIKVFLLVVILIIVAAIANNEMITKAVDASNICDFVTNISYIKIT